MDKLPPIPSPPGTVFREFRVAVLPFVVFAAVLGLTVYTWSNYVGPSNFVGEVAPIRSIVSSTQPGHLTLLNVGLLDRIRAGQPLAVVEPADPRVLAAELGLSRARLGFLRDNMDARLRQQNNQISYLQLRLDWLNQRAEVASLKAQQGYFRAELDRQQTMAVATAATVPGERGSARINSVAEYEIAKRDFDSLTAQIEERTLLINEIEASMNRIRPEESRLEDEIPAALRNAVNLEERELGLLEGKLGAVTLTAPMDGVVSFIYRRAGENIIAGEPILTLSALRSDHIVAFVRQPLTLEVRTNMAVEIRSRGPARDFKVGRVIAVGTQMEAILPQLLPRSGGGGNVPEYGLPILVSLPPDLRVIPGEIVDLNPTTD